MWRKTCCLPDIRETATRFSSLLDLSVPIHTARLCLEAGQDACNVQAHEEGQVRSAHSFYHSTEPMMSGTQHACCTSFGRELPFGTST